MSYSLHLHDDTHAGTSPTGVTPLRSYSKCELAQLYDPGASRATALRMLHRYITSAHGLLPALQRTGYRASHRRFTRHQVELIFAYLGEP